MTSLYVSIPEAKHSSRERVSEGKPFPTDLQTRRSVGKWAVKDAITSVNV